MATFNDTASRDLDSVRGDDTIRAQTSGLIPSLLQRPLRQSMKKLCMKQTIIEYDSIPLYNLPRLTQNLSVVDQNPDNGSVALILKRGITFKKDPFVNQFKPKTGFKQSQIQRKKGRFNSLTGFKKEILDIKEKINANNQSFYKSKMDKTKNSLNSSSNKGFIKMPENTFDECSPAKQSQHPSDQDNEYESHISASPQKS